MTTVGRKVRQPDGHHDDAGRTVPPSVTFAGTGSPVIMLRSIADWPNTTPPSAAIRSPAGP